MTFRTLIRRSLRFHWRSHLGVVLGAAVGSAALIGALVVGDSVRGSLRESALNRLGATEVALDSKDRFFREQLAEHFTNRAFASVLRLGGSASRVDNAARANQVQVLGIEENFNRMTGRERNRTDAFNWPQQLSDDAAVLNSALAAYLNVSVGDTILLRFAKPTALAAEAAISPRNDSSAVARLKISAICPNHEPLGTFALQPGASPPFNMFVSIALLQHRLGKPGSANLLLLSGTTPEEANARLRASWQLADTELHLTHCAPSNTLELRTPRVFLDPPVIRAALNANSNSQPVLTYLVNLLRAGTNTTPYSMVTAAGFPWTPPEMRDDQIIINQWLADDLQVKSGDAIALTYFDPESGGRLLERTNTFRVHSIVPMDMRWADRTLMPDFPGIEKAESTRDWNAGFPLVHKIRQKDEDYWKQHRGTPKAFVTLATGKKIWANRFGELTAIRFTVPLEGTAPSVPQLSTNRSSDEALPSTGYRTALEKAILANLKPEELGLRFEPVREQALTAAEESQDFGGLFLGFSFFLIVAALLLMAMLFQFGLEQRIEEVGTLLALGFTPKQVRRLLLGEVVALAFAGGVLGALGGISYARAMLYGLTTIWRDAVGASALNFQMTPQTLVLGLLASTTVCATTIWLSLRKSVKRPARELLAGEVQSPKTKAQSRGRWLGMATILGAIGLIVWMLAKGDAANAGAFFGAGALVLIAGLAATNLRLIQLGSSHLSTLTPALSLRARENRSPTSGAATAAENSTIANTKQDVQPLFPLPAGEGQGEGERHKRPSLFAFALRGCARRRTRSLSTVAMLACGSFLIVSIGVFRLDANLDATKRSSGTGGFALIGETTMPVVHDLNRQSGHDFFALSGRELEGVSFVPFRVRDGDEASCLNLTRAQKPRLLGVRPEMLRGRFTFTKGRGWQSLRGYARESVDETESGHEQPRSNERSHEIPAIGDANSIQWAMHKKVGDTIDYVDERGQPFKVRIVGAVANSILQGSLVIDEVEFVKRFPGESGYRTFLIDAPSNSVSQVSAMLSRAMQDIGLELTPATQRLAQFNAVQNTYLGTFQVLGGLGLLLGSVGLGIVVLRNVLERRGELALLQAVGFTRRTLQRMLLIEHGALLLAGLGVGVLAAAVAVLPSVLSPSSHLPYRSFSLTLVAVLINGVIWTWIAARVASRGNLLAALRNE